MERRVTLRQVMSIQQETTVLFFATPSALQKWFLRNHAKEKELWIGLHKKHTSRSSITWPEAVDQALCVGWIDGVRKRIDDSSYKIRFTPRRPRSIWSTVNIKRAEVLQTQEKMQSAGLKAFLARNENKVDIYSYEQRTAELPKPYADILRRNQAAWQFFTNQPSSYRKMVCWWIVSAKQETTCERRLTKLILESARGKRLTR